MSNKVIIFGPTGNVGSHAARTAQQHGSKVFLAMRDTSKSIQGLSTEQEKQGGFERISADLGKPNTVVAAVKHSGAKRAFIYMIPQSPDHLKSSIEALKSAGIELVVFLGSSTVDVGPTLAEIPQSDIIPYMHAQVELNLESVYGAKGYVSLRPGCFATNTSHWWSGGLRAGELKLFAPNATVDYITPDDMGAVAGTILATGTQNGQKIVYLMGPQFISFEEGVEIIQKEALTERVKVTSSRDEDEMYKTFISQGAPPPMAKTLASAFLAMDKGEPQSQFDHLKEGQENVQKYLHRPGMTFQEFVRQNKADYV